MSETIVNVARDQLRALASMMKIKWHSKEAHVLVKQFGALAELASERGLSELSTLSRAISASVLLYSKEGPDQNGRERLMDLGRKVNAALNSNVMAKAVEKEKEKEKASEGILIGEDFRPVYMLVDTDPKQSAVVPKELLAALAAKSFALHAFADGDRLGEELAKTTPAVLICEASLMPAVSEMLDVIEKDQPGLSMRIPILALNRLTSSARRLTAALGWADAYLEAPTLEQICEQVVEMANASDESAYQVLIVDDDRQQAMFCAGVLRRKGMEVKSALSADEALKMLSTTRPDLVLMDLYMPGLDGLELTALLRQRSDSLLLPIVFLSGEQDTQKRFDALNVGGDDYLTKPIRPRHLATAVASRIKRVRALRAQLAEARAPVTTQGMYRKQAFLELLQTRVENRGPAVIGLIFLALDHADSLSADLGLFGQSALEQELSNRITDGLEKGDALTSLGNFEYAVLAQRADAERLLKLAEQLRQTVSIRPVRIKDDEYALSYSIGVAENSDSKGSAERWILLAQMASQRAATCGGNRVERANHESLRVSAARTKVIDDVLQEPPTRSNTATEYQPLVPLRSNPLAQYVQMLRLRGNTVATSNLSRKDYLGPAERSGTIARLDRFAAQQAIDAIKESARFGRPVMLHMRAAASALLGDLAIGIRSELSMAGIDAAQLTLEFDLHELELDLTPAVRKIEQLRSLGVGIALAVSLPRPKLLATLEKIKPDVIKIHSALLQKPSADFIKLIADWRGRAMLVGTDLSSPEHLPALWSQHLDYVQADFLGEARPQLDFVFAPLKESA
jgi:diguanylate cyclase (GGDEF)-like protein